jgi:hypothetical protein
MVEFHRFGPTQALLSPSGHFIRTTGWDGRATDVAPTIDHEGLLRRLNLLRYNPAGKPSEVEEARRALSSEATAFLPPVEPSQDELVQVDLVTNAAELWAFPFEACFAGKAAWLSSPSSGVEVTRRIRGDFSDQRSDWPDKPKVLFLHAPIAPDLQQDLVGKHVAGLTEALSPWSRGKDVRDSGLLEVQEVWSAQEMADAMAKVKPTYVHVLAHGADIRPDPVLYQKVVWGLRLGTAAASGVDPVAVAEALTPAGGPPFVVTLAACDSGNQADSVFGAGSLAQELHRRGVPVVVGSQFPLTQASSPVLVRSFYTRLCRGEDVRVALHAARVELKAAPGAAHDWLSLVGYVRLPEGYGEHLLRVGLKAELGMLDALQRRMDRVLEDGGPLDRLDEIESLVRSRLQSLEGRCAGLMDRRDLLDECFGLQASACKRIAELRFLRGRLSPGSVDADRTASRQALEESLKRYRTAYEADIHSHWLGMQQLALEAILNGKIADADDWKMVRRAAALVRDAPPPAKGPRDYWSGGTLVELFLLCPLAGRDPESDRTREAVKSFRERTDAARTAGDAGGADFAVQSLRRQLNRYVTWWTKANGFFPGRDSDLAEDARAILRLLE